MNARTQADTEYLARELAAVRIALGDVVTTADLRESVDRMAQALARVEARLDGLDIGSGAIDPDAPPSPS